MSEARNSDRQPFRLLPFEATPELATLHLDGTVARSRDGLQLIYRLQGNLSELAIPEAASAPERRDGLWQATCLEAFLAVPAAEPYWEVNLSPAGHWNVYRLNGYRQGLAPEPALQQLPFQVSRRETGLELSLALPLPPAILPPQPLQIGITAVLQRRDGSLSYWALAHHGAEADFHRRDGFLLEL